MWNLKSGDLTRIRGQNGPGDDYLAAAAWHSTVYGATKREKSPSTQLNLSLVEKKLGLRFQTSLYFKLKLLSRTMSLLSYTSDRPKIRFGQTFWQCLVSSVSDKEWKNFASSVVPIFAIFWKKCTDFSMKYLYEFSPSENESMYTFSKSDSTTQHVRTKANKSGLYACHQTVPSLEVKSSDHE